MGAGFLESRIQAAIEGLDGEVAAHLVLCAGPFPGLNARMPLILPFDAALSELEQRGLRTLEVVVPFEEQASPSARRWRASGHPCRTHAMDSKPATQPVASWLKDRCEGQRADAIVFDYVGFPPGVLTDVSTELALPVLDLGHVAIAALRRILSTP